MFINKLLVYESCETKIVLSKARDCVFVIEKNTKVAMRVVNFFIDINDNTCVRIF